MNSMKILIRVSIALGVLGLGLTMSSTAFAQQGVINLEESVIKGRIQKPEAFYILQPASLDYEALDAKPSFVDALLETVEDEPF